MTQQAATATASLPPPPDRLPDGAHLFLDFDGTLVPLAPTPDAVQVDAGLPDLLDALAAAYPGRIGILTGRSVEQIDAMLGPVAGRLAVGASHGAELRLPGAVPAPSARPAGLAAATEAVLAFAAGRPGVMAEVKAFGTGLHYRAAPEHGPAAHTLVDALAARHGLVSQPGKMMAEIRAPGTKGAMLARLADGAPAAMLGDDVTDEDAFAAAAALGGFGVLVGDPRPTAAGFGLPDVPAVRAWLAGLLP